MELVKCSENIEFSYQNPRISEWRNRLIGQIAVAMQNMFFDVSQIKKTHREAEKHLQQKFYSLIFLLITVATLLLVASFFWIYRSLINPIIQLQKGAEIIGAGNLNYQIQLSGHDEISELSRSFNAMTEKLSLYLAELEKEIKKRIETEEKMLELNKDLEKAVQDEIDKRGKHEQVLLQQSKLAAMGEMMSAIAHHWRQPLNVINLINFNILSAFHEGELDEAYLEKAVDDSKKQVLYLSKTIDNFRNYYKPSNVKTEFDIKDAAAEAFNLLSSELQINYIDYSLSCHIHNKTFYNYSYNQCCNEMKATLYKNEFIQVLMNLIYNARDAILKKREAGLLGIQHGSIDIGFYKLKNNRLRIVVEDNGGGIPEDIMDRIFEPYFTTKFQSQGAGIGLYMTKLLIEKNMNGVIYAQNIEEGAQLIIEFDQEQSR
jgi:signal transduction histidine kinase